MARDAIEVHRQQLHQEIPAAVAAGTVSAGGWTMPELLVAAGDRQIRLVVTVWLGDELRQTSVEVTWDRGTE